MSKQPLLQLFLPPRLAALAALPCVAPPASGQQAPADFPDGPGKQTFVNLCGACHDINRVRVGYTPEGWHTVMRMMLNFDVPVPKDEVDTLTQYLIKNFPERARPAAVVIPGPVEAAIKLWQVPTPGSLIRSPRATAPSGTPGNSPASSAASIPRPASSRNIRSRRRRRVRTVWSKTRTATSGSPGTT
jgi:hypothetical protein